ncbi:MAG TPA: hypothetical protein VHH34_25215 [Pseudonocardiaceae bacterium]|nr:hypothetical protein [Pseudonocardiaceae bacterium]
MIHDVGYSPPRTGLDLQRRYAHLLAADPASARGLTDAATNSELLRVGYGNGFLPAPVFLTGEERRRLAEDLTTVYALLRALPERLFGGDHRRFAAAVGMTPTQIEVSTRTGTGGLEPLGRADLYRTQDGFQLLELNITSALGGFENAEINRAMLAHPALREFIETHGLSSVDTLAGIVAVLRRDCAPFLTRDRPVVALVDWPDSYPTYGPRLGVWARMLTAFGLDAVPCHVGHLEADAGSLRIAGRRVDVVFRFFLTEEIATPADFAMVSPILDAAERGTVGLFCRMDAELYGNKGALALLSDEESRDAFSAAELTCLDRFLPWTRPVRRGLVCDPRGDLVDLCAFAVEHQDQLILKPTLLHGGSGIVPGWTVARDRWQAALEEAVSAPGWVLQQRVRPVAEPFYDPDRDEVRDFFLNWGVFLVSTETTGSDGYGGCIVRGSPSPDVGVVSMREGARVGCCFHESVVFG